MTARNLTAADLPPAMPRPSGAFYIHRTPPWLVAGLRAFLAAFAVALVVLSAREWATMPLPAKGLIAVLAPALGYFALARRVWQRTVKFLADGRGIHFPHNSQLVYTLGQPPKADWLLVPWHHVANIRVAKVAGEDGATLALCFDVKVTAAQAEAFLAHVALPRDGRSPAPAAGWVAVGYADRPPHPAKTAARLEALRAG